MPQGGLKAHNQKVKENNKKPKVKPMKKGTPKASVNKTHKLHREGINNKLSKIINKNIEAEMIKKALKNNPGSLTILKQTKLQANESLNRRKKLMTQAEAVVEQKFH